MPRFSEDLDFSLVKAGLEDNFTELMKKIKGTFEAEDYKLTIKAKMEKTVKSAFLKFEGLLYEIGLSPHRSETISIKVEIDTNPIRCWIRDQCRTQALFVELTAL